MSRALSSSEALAIRMYRQGLAGQRVSVPARGAGKAVAAAAQAAAGIQAQDLLASQLAVRARSSRLELIDVTRACDTRGVVVRTWLMRGTLHMVAATDAHWLVGLLGPGIVKQYRRRREQLGLTADVCGRALAVMTRLIGPAPLTRAELMSGLAEHHVHIDTSGQAPAHMLLFAAASGLICRGPDRGREPTYVPLESWAGTDGPTGVEAAAVLARQYLDAFGPASAEDFASWSGLPAGTARNAIAEAGAPVTVDGRATWLTGGVTAAPRDSWRLLGAFDSYLLGYRNRDLALDSKHARRIHAGGGWIHPSVICDGRVVGTWRLRRTGRPATASVELFDRSTKGAAAALAAEAKDLGRFLGEPCELELS